MNSITNSLNIINSNLSTSSLSNHAYLSKQSSGGRGIWWGHKEAVPENGQQVGGGRAVPQEPVVAQGTELLPGSLPYPRQTPDTQHLRIHACKTGDKKL